MTLRELIDLISRKLDDVVQPFLWDDTELTQAINDRINELCEKTGLLRDSSTVAICTIAVVLGTAKYALDDRIIKILSVKYGTSYTELYPVTRAYLDEQFQNWESDTGVPRYFLLDDTATITLYPNPSADSHIHLSVTRYPLVQMTLLSENLEPEIHWKYHSRLVDGVLALAYEKNDSETIALARVKHHEALWNKTIDEIHQGEANYYNYGTVLAPALGNI